MTSPAQQNTPSNVNEQGNAEGGADTNNNNKSALQDNIERKGKNAYYYAHGHKVNGPAWDGKAEPRLLSRQESNDGHFVSRASSFDYRKSNITQYAFLDDGNKVKLYITLPGVGEKCSSSGDNDNISLDYTETSLCLMVRNYNKKSHPQEGEEENEPLCLQFGKLTAEITDATFRLKPDKIIVTLKKAREGVWHSINDKGTSDHEVV